MEDVAAVDEGCISDEAISHESRHCELRALGHQGADLAETGGYDRLPPTDRYPRWGRQSRPDEYCRILSTTSGGNLGR